MARIQRVGRGFRQIRWQSHRSSKLLPPGQHNRTFFGKCPCPRRSSAQQQQHRTIREHIESVTQPVKGQPEVIVQRHRGQLRGRLPRGAQHVQEETRRATAQAGQEAVQVQRGMGQALSSEEHPRT